MTRKLLVWEPVAGPELAFSREDKGPFPDLDRNS